MRNELVQYKPQYIEIAITTASGTTTVTLDNTEIRGDVEYRSGRYTEIFVAPAGQTTSMAHAAGKEFRFSLRAWENVGARKKYQQIWELTQQRYSATFTFYYYQSAFTTFPDEISNFTSSDDEYETIQAAFSSAVLLLEDNFVDAIARGEGPVHPQSFEIVVREGQGDGLSLIDLPAAALSCDDMSACGGTVSINGTGSADGDGTAITTGSDVTLRWRFGSYVTADIAAGDDPALIGNWAIQSGWGSTVFENIILDNIASGTAINFELQPDALSQKTGDASITVGLTVIDDGNTSDETTCSIELVALDTIFETATTKNGAYEEELQFWGACKAIRVWDSGNNDQETLSVTTSRDAYTKTYTSGASKSTALYSSAKLRQVAIDRQNLTSFSLTTADQLEVIALSPEYVAGGPFSTDVAFTNANSNAFTSIDLSAATNAREIYLIDCDIPTGSLTLPASTALEILSIDSQPVMNSTLLSFINSNLTGLRKLRIGYDATGGALASPSFSAPNLEALTAYNANISGTVTITSTDIREINLGGNASLTAFDPSAYLQLRKLYMMDTGITSLDVTQNAALEVLYISNSITSTTVDTDNNPLLRVFSADANDNITSLDFTQNGRLQTMFLQLCDLLTSLTLPTSNNFKISTFNMNFSPINYDRVNFDWRNVPYATDVDGCTISANTCSLSAAEVNQFLVDLDSISQANDKDTNTTPRTGRSIVLTANTAPDSSSGGVDGVAAKASLISKGFSVTTD
jgi:hypothetical protein